MKPHTNITVFGCAALIGLTLVSITWYLVKAIPTGTNYTAKYLCTNVFVAGREADAVFKEDILPVNSLLRLLTYHVNRAEHLVTVDLYGMSPVKAVYRESCGCTLVIGTTETQLRAQELTPPDFARTRPVHAPDLAWPAGEQTATDLPSSAIDAAKLNMALDHAFAESGTDIRRRTRAVVVVYDGRLVAERYAPGFHKDMALMGWSMSKSVTNAIVGILKGQGRLDIMSPAPVPEWQLENDPRKAITIDQLLRMSSGLAFHEVYAPHFDATKMLYCSYDMGAIAADCALDSQSRDSWHYSSGTTNIIARMVRGMLTPSTRYYYSFFYKQLFDRIGMYSAIFEPDPSGTFVGSSYLVATPRDWARFGLFCLQDGVWDGQRILPQGWMAYTTTPTPNAPKGQYGAHFWLNAGRPNNPSDRLWPDAPRDAYAALGFQKQVLVMIPSRKAVLVRLGATSDKKAWDTNRFITEVLAALPGETPENAGRP